MAPPRCRMVRGGCGRDRLERVPSQEFLPAWRLPAIWNRVGRVTMHAAVPLGVVSGEDRFASPIGADPPDLYAPAVHHDPSGAALQAKGPWFGINEGVQNSRPPACRAPPPGHLLAWHFGSRNLVEPIQVLRPRRRLWAGRRSAGQRERELGLPITVTGVAHGVFGPKAGS